MSDPIFHSIARKPLFNIAHSLSIAQCCTINILRTQRDGVTDDVNLVRSTEMSTSQLLPYMNLPARAIDYQDSQAAVKIDFYFIFLGTFKFHANWSSEIMWTESNL